MEDGVGSVGDGELVVAGGEAPSLLETVEGAFDDVAGPVGLGVQGRVGAYYEYTSRMNATYKNPAR
jgi:hypothetical protein